MKVNQYELCHWIISQDDVAYSHITMVTSAHILATLEVVEVIMGIPCNAVDIALSLRRTMESLNYGISKLEQDIPEKEVKEEFLKKFMIFTCVTIITLNSMLEGAHNI